MQQGGFLHKISQIS